MIKIHQVDTIDAEESRQVYALSYCLVDLIIRVDYDDQKA